MSDPTQSSTNVLINIFLCFKTVIGLLWILDKDVSYHNTIYKGLIKLMVHVRT